MKKIYIEISDICGLKCSFCPTPKGIRGVMDLGLFKKVAFESKRYTNLIALHILGDPLSVENLSHFLAIAREAKLKVEITTSGANLKNFDLLLESPIKQVNFSLDALNEMKNKEALFARIVDFCKYKIYQKSDIFVNLRVQKRARNKKLIAFLEREFVACGGQNLARFLGDSNGDSSANRVKLGNKIIVDFRDIFAWNVDFMPLGNRKNLSTQDETIKTNSSIVDEKSGLRSHEREDKTNALSPKRVASLHDLSPQDEFVKGTCYALKNHIGILANGEIVPCCMDFSGILSLGNIRDISIKTALNSRRAQEMLRGFRENRVVEAFCKSCDYRKRFDLRLESHI